MIADLKISPMRRALIVLPCLPCLWLACAIAGAMPPACQPEAAQVLAAVNALRADAHRCGADAMAPARPLRWNEALALSAQRYAEELARRQTLSHEGQVLRSLGMRLRAAGYDMQQAGENLAAGQDDLAEVMAQWVSSPGHCKNLMQPAYEDVGLACVASPGRYGHYWVLHLGRRAQQQQPSLLSAGNQR